MTALFIILGIVLTLRLLLCLRGHIRIVAGDNLKITLRILFIKIPIYPKKKSPKKLLSQEKEKKKKQTKKQKKTLKNASNGKKPTKKSKKKSYSSLLRILKLVGGILWKIRKTFPDHLRLTISRFVIKVGGEDATAAAIKYGAVSASASFAFGALERYARVKVKRGGQLLITPDYLSPDFAYDIDLSVSVSMQSLLKLGLRILLSYLKSSKTNTNHKKTSQVKNTPVCQGQGA